MQVGITGVPNAGKTTLFNALTGAHARCDAYRFTTIDPNIGVAHIPDERLLKIAEVEHAEKVIPATIKFVDVAGLIEGASKGEGLGNQFLSAIRGVDVIVHALRGFYLESEGEPSPVKDAQTVITEFILADLEIVERRLEKVRKKVKTGEKDEVQELDALERAKSWLESFKPLYLLNKNEKESKIAFYNDLITAKPALFVLNVEDPTSEKTRELFSEVEKIAKEHHAVALISAAKTEMELNDIEDEKERMEFAESFGVSEFTVSAVAREAYNFSGLISFFTTKSRECRAWELKKGSTAVEAAAKVHTDMAKGFVKAEVVYWKDLVNAGSWAAAREQGKVLLEGREYIVRDGDVITFRFTS